MSITVLDFILIGVVLLSALLAMVRGFTREVLSIASWAAAAFATLYLLPMVRDYARSQINLEPKILVDVMAGGAIFIVTLIVVSLITMRLSDAILDSRIGPFDRGLGFLYGGARGFLLAVIAFLFFSWLVPTQQQPAWAVQAASRPALESAGAQLRAMLPEDPESTILNRFKDLPGSSGDPANAPDVDSQAPAGGESGETERPPGESGYRPAERQNMQRLLNTTQAPD
ncbi:CvpA family protein [Terrihabitans rhizophilus]|uniref:CvpA family protein n=1 Tax=Terrihabitans rhizophilus TaxID=3092662 RepID=A0ABU4RNE8_9HYPH|nr:CvpA family protein [Terrihabitans sp. PJ23]MDX6805240.1 CvpA family protein [Terrihabitans sp. PJ23]